MRRPAVAYRRIASRLLSERGLAAVWQLHLDALSAHLNGYAGAAALMLAIADAAEERASAARLARLRPHQRAARLPGLLRARPAARRRPPSGRADTGRSARRGYKVLRRHPGGMHPLHRDLSSHGY